MDGPIPNETQRRILGDNLAGEFIRNYDPVDNDYDDSDTDDSFENDVYVSDAQQHWDENMRQLEQAVFHVLCPVLGRLFGRRFAQKMWMRFVTYRWRLAYPETVFEKV